MLIIMLYDIDNKSIGGIIMEILILIGLSILLVWGFYNEDDFIEWESTLFDD